MTAERESMTLQEMDAPALGVEERRDEAPRAGASHARSTPDPEVVAKPKRRKFTAQYRLRILEEAEGCTQPGEVGRLLRREGVAPINPICRRNPSIPGLCRIASPTCARPFELSLPWSVRLSSAARRCILRTLPCDSSLPP